jgi:hypothetical protein
MEYMEQTTNIMRNNLITLQQNSNILWQNTDSLRKKQLQYQRNGYDIFEKQ